LVNRGTPGDLEVLEAGSHRSGFELCFQQSAGDSPGPEVDSLLRILGHGLLYHDVANLKSP
jgi:hypothetical protein